MVRIAIVDDDSKLLLLIRRNIAEALDFTQVEVEIFECAEDFLDAMTLEEPFDILVTDIELPNLNGMELGRIVREKWPDMGLVFLTSHDEHAAESYGIDADQYILKQDMGTRLWKVLKRLIEKRIAERSSYRLVSTSEDDISEKRLVYCYEIIFISKVKGSKYVEYVTTNGHFKERTTLETLKEELPESEFIMVDRSYIVNIKQIIKLNKHTIYLKGDHQVSVSRSYYPKVKRQIHEYGRRR